MVWNHTNNTEETRARRVESRGHLDRFEQIESIFHEASNLPERERAPFLESACSGDPDLHREVALLLKSAQDATGNPAWRAGAVASEAARVAETAGSADFDRYRVLDRIGAGGMGVVSRAVRIDEDIPQVVAIKIAHTAHEDPAARERFVQERRILSRLEHPNIARLIDGGTTLEGIPFLVMEYVDGVALNRYVSEHSLSLPATLRLFRKICDAVSYAHRNLVAHRDLKPANILVTPEGEPKLLDFGIATMVDGSGLRTKTGAGALTPDYASPEQVRGEPAAAASDIYSLGVLLYQALTGRLPYRDTQSPLERAQSITDSEPLALNGQGLRFDKDLETIVRMAMRKEPERRYSSVEQFSADLGRYLDGYPVSARATSFGYRAAKFVRRNRFSLGAAALLLLAVAGGIAATIRQANIANRWLAEVRELAGDRSLSLELADGYQHPLVDRTHAEDPSGAIASDRKRYAVLESILAQTPDDAEIGKRLIAACRDAALKLTDRGDLRGATEFSRKAVTLAERMAALHPGDRTTRRDLAMAYASLGDVLGGSGFPNLGYYRQALELYDKSLSILLKLAAEDPGHMERLTDLQPALIRLAAVYSLGFDDQNAALSDYSAAALLSEWVRDHSAPSVSNDLTAAMRSSIMMRHLARLGRYEEADRRAASALATLQAILKKDPGLGSAKRELARLYFNQARVLTTEYRAAGGKSAADARKKSRAALALCRKGLKIFEEMHAAKLVAESDLLWRAGMRTETDLQLEAGDAAHALETATRGRRIDEDLLKKTPENEIAAENFALSCEETGLASKALGQSAEARPWLQQSLDIFEARHKAGTLARVSEREIEKLRALLAQ